MESCESFLEPRGRLPEQPNVFLSQLQKSFKFLQPLQKNIAMYIPDAKFYLKNIALIKQR